MTCPPSIGNTLSLLFLPKLHGLVLCVGTFLIFVSSKINKDVMKVMFILKPTFDLLYNKDTLCNHTNVSRIKQKNKYKLQRLYLMCLLQIIKYQIHTNNSYIPNT